MNKQKMSKSIIVNDGNKEHNTEKSSLKKGGLFTLLLFVLSGCPNAFNIQDALWLELPWFERSQPEGKMLASKLIIAQGVSTLLFLSLLYIETHVWTFPKLRILYCCSFLTLLTCIALSFGWNFSLGGTSLFLILGTSAGEMVGWVQYIFVIPWIAKNYNPRIISPFMSGDDLTALILMFLQIIQQPGGAQYFSPTLWYLIGVGWYAITLCVCVFTFQSGIGRLVPTDKTQATEEIPAVESWRNSLWSQSFPSMFWDTKLVTFGRIWVHQWSWTVIPIALPYASGNTTGLEADDGVNFLQWAISMGVFMSLAGALSSYIPTEKFWIGEGIALNTISNGVILIAAADIGEWSSWNMRIVLMTAIAVSRFSYGWVLPLCMRELTRRFPDNKELLVRSNSLWTLYSNIVLRGILWIIPSRVLPW